jgi:hypothetical protein
VFCVFLPFEPAPVFTQCQVDRKRQATV